jgi:hypothetical protein
MGAIFAIDDGSVKIQPISHAKSLISVFNGFTTPEQDKNRENFAALFVK